MDLSGKKVAVYGLGVTGLAVLEALQKIDLGQLVIVNGVRPSQAELRELQFKVTPLLLAEGEESSQEVLGAVDLILLSPGIPRSNSVLDIARQNKVAIWNEIEWCSQGFNGELIGITGTNGKTTTVTFLDQAFKKAGVKVFTGGNIGIPFSTIYHKRDEYDLALLEMSSFQCESLESFRPGVAAYLNLFANHGERYSSVDDYRLSKWEIARNQLSSDTIFVGPGVGISPSFITGEVHEMDESWCEELNEFIDWRRVQLVGVHNRQNIWFAWRIYKEYFIRRSLSVPTESFQNSLYSFSGVEHRVEACSSFIGHMLFNDAKSTNWQATLSALKAVKELSKPIILIIGGKLRGLNDEPNPEELTLIASLATEVIGIGEAAKYLEKKWPKLVNVENLKGARKWIEENAANDSCVLFSPAFPSFDQFKNYADRGLKFKEVFNS